MRWSGWAMVAVLGMVAVRADAMSCTTCEPRSTVVLQSVHVAGVLQTDMTEWEGWRYGWITSSNFSVSFSLEWLGLPHTCTTCTVGEAYEAKP